MELVHGSCTTNILKLQLSINNGQARKRQWLLQCTSRGQHGRCLQHCSRVTTSSTPHCLTVWNRDSDKNTCPSEEVGTQKPHTEVWGRITRLCGIHSTSRPIGISKHRPRICGECCSGQLCKWKPRLGSAVTSPHALLQKHHCSNGLCTGSWSCKKSISQTCNGSPDRKRKSEEAKIIFQQKKNTQIPTYCATKRQVSSKKKHAQEVRILQLGCDSLNVYINAWNDQLKKSINVCVDTGATRSILRRDSVESPRGLGHQSAWTTGTADCHRKIINNFWKCSLEASIANFCHWRKVYSGRHLWWMHSWAWPYKEIWPDCGFKERTIKGSTWWHTITGTGNKCSSTSQQ